MANTITMTAAAARVRTLSASPLAPSTAVPWWREQVPSLRVPAGMRNGSAFDSLNHNSIPAILRSTVVVTADVTPSTTGDVYGAAKQAAPPRGVPR